MIGLLKRLARMFQRSPDPQAGRLREATDRLDRRTQAAVDRANRAIREAERIDRAMNAADVSMGFRVPGPR